MNKQRLIERHQKYLERLENVEQQIAQAEAASKSLMEQRLMLQGAILELQEIIKEVPEIPLPTPPIPTPPIESSTETDAVSKL